MNENLLTQTKQEQYKHWLITAIGIFVILYFAYRVRSVLNPLLFSLCVAYIMNPIVVALEKRGVPRLLTVISAFCLIAVIAFAAIVGILGLMTQISALSNWLMEKIPVALNYIKQKLPEQYLANLQTNLDTLTQNAVSQSGKVVQYLITTVTTILSSTATVINLVLLVPLYTFFFLWRFDHIISAIEKDYLPPAYHDRVVDIAKKLDAIIAEFFRGRLIVSIFVGIATSISFVIVGVPFAWVLGLAIGVLNLVPYLSTIVGLPPALVMTYFAYFDFWHPLYALILFSIIQFIDAYILTPIIQQKTLGLHPITSIVVLMMGYQLAGIFGLLLAIPATAAIKVLIREFIWPDFAQVSKHIDNNNNNTSLAEQTDTATGQPNTEQP